MIQSKVIKQDELQEALRLLYANVITSTAVSAFISGIFVYSISFGDQDNYSHKVIWWLILMSVLSFRLFDLAIYRKKASQQYHYSEKDLWRFSFLSILVAMIWGIYPLYFASFLDPAEMIAIVIIGCGITSGVANMWSAHKFTAISCVLVLSGPYSIFMLFSEGQYDFLIGIMGTLYTFVMSLSAARFSSFTYKAIRLKNQNSLLLKDMEKQVEKRTQEIYQLSNVDNLTGLLNRTAFLKELNKLVSENVSTQFAVLFIDLDGFKKVNDSLGHEVGDKVIKATALRVASLSQGPLPICRWGGDEFLVAYQFETTKDIDAFAQQIIEKISLPHFLSQSKIWVGASIGVALYPEHSDNYDTLIQNSDMAMYNQKRLEKGKVGYFNESLREQITRERLLSTRLFTAIEEKTLRLVFQPIINSTTGEVTCLEALLRWNMDGEEVSPVEFIPVAEQYGMIKNIGLWVLEEACQQIIALAEDGKTVNISVNVSVVQLQDKNFVKHVTEVLTRLSFNPSQLHIEITESVFAADKTVLMAQIKALQKMDIKISIDDFGTGYSSLSSMQDLGVDFVKIDKSFIDQINGSGLNIIHAVMQIAQPMGYQVIAEGVESLEQVETLNEIGVSFIQGYYFSKPLEVEPLTEYLNHHL